MRAILADTEVDAAVFGNVPLTTQIQSLPPGLSRSDVFNAPAGYAVRVIRLFRETKRPFVVVIDAGGHYDPLADYLQEAGLPVFRSADRATRMFGIYIETRTA